MFSFIANLKIKFFHSTSRIFRKYNHPNGYLYNMMHLTVAYGELCLQNHLLVRWLGLCLILGLSVSWGLGLVLGLCDCWLVAM